MRRLRLVLEYDGTDFDGFQRQPGRRTVQTEMERRLAMVCGHPVTTVGAGRTDAGVHALGQVVHFDTMGRIPVERLARAANAQGGPELFVRLAEETQPDFHARFSAVRRTYRCFFSRARPSPFQARYVLHEADLPPDAGERMRQALPGLVGRHDFACLAARGAEGEGTVRTVHSAGLEEWGSLLCLELTADAFLRNMVRRIAGVLVRIGLGREAPQALGRALEEGRRPRPAVTAGPQGLFLTRVEYPDGFPPRSAREAAWPEL